MIGDQEIIDEFLFNYIFEKDVFNQNATQDNDRKLTSQSERKKRIIQIKYWMSFAIWSDSLRRLRTIQSKI